MFGPFDVGGLPEKARSMVFTGTADDLAAFDVVLGHFSSQMLKSGRAWQDMAVLFREPRARLLSHYSFWRSWSDEQHDVWGPYDVSRRAVEDEWPDFLCDTRIATQVDNIAARLVLGEHPLISPTAFIEDSAVEQLTHEALEIVAQFGFVDVIENGDDCWGRLGDWSDLSLDIGHRNSTPIDSGPPPDWGRIADSDVIRSLDSRTAIDEKLWLAAAAIHAPNDDADELRRRANLISDGQISKMLDRAELAVPPSPESKRFPRAVAALQRAESRLRRR